jgi:hypothetical protein
MSDFIKSSILQGLKMNEFSELPKPTLRKLVKLMARISERSYRRGVQQALSVGCIHPVSNWRYAPLERSAGIDTPSSKSVIYRLFEQNPELDQVGLEDRKKNQRI